ncbi:MAG: LamG-like jellyroll fold domain-containing protein [Candidatus Cyclobacteriaceae bacterium M3_2C_046]
MSICKWIVSGWFILNVLLVQGQEISSSALNATIPLSIHPTGDADQEQTFIPLVYLGDQTQVNFVASLSDYLVKQEGWPHLLVVGIDPTSGADLREKLKQYINYAQDPLQDFLTEELFQYLGQNYSLHPFRILAGHQEAGAYVFTTMMDQQDTYHAFICLAPAFYQLPQAELAMRTFLVDHFEWDDFLYIAQGFGDNTQMKESLELSRLLNSHSIERPIDYHFEFFDQVKNSSLLPEAMPDALRKLFADLDLGIMLNYGGVDYLWEKKARLADKYDFDPLNLRLPKIPVSQILLSLGMEQPDLLPSRFRMLWHQHPERYDFDKTHLINLKQYFENIKNDLAAGQLQTIISDPAYQTVNQSPYLTNNYSPIIKLEQGKLMSVLTSSSKVEEDLQIEGAEINTDPIKSIRFDGKDDYAIIKSDQLNDLTGSFSVSTWIRPNSVERFEAFISQAVEGETKSHWRIGFGPMPASQWGLSIWNNAWKDYLINQIIPLNSWSHLAVVVDQSLGQVTYYLNGEPVNTVEQVFPLFSSQEPVVIGRNNRNGGYFDGSLSYIHLYRRGLSDSEVKALFERNKKDFQ